MQLDDNDNGGGGHLYNDGQPNNQHPVAAIGMDGVALNQTNYLLMDFEELCQVNQ